MEVVKFFCPITILGILYITTTVKNKSVAYILIDFSQIKPILIIKYTSHPYGHSFLQDEDIDVTSIVS